jgi:hypothetical protein
MTQMKFESGAVAYTQYMRLTGTLTTSGPTSTETYEGVSKSFRTDRLERELQMVQLYATKCSCIIILWVSVVSFASITLCIASQCVFTVVCYFVMESVRKFWIYSRNIIVDSYYSVYQKYAGYGVRVISVARGPSLFKISHWSGAFRRTVHSFRVVIHYNLVGINNETTVT